MMASYLFAKHECQYKSVDDFSCMNVIVFDKFIF